MLEPGVKQPECRTAGNEEHRPCDRRNHEPLGNREILERSEEIRERSQYILERGLRFLGFGRDFRIQSNAPRTRKKSASLPVPVSR